MNSPTLMSAATRNRPLPVPREPPPADPRLVADLATACECPATIVVGWLEGRAAPPPELRRRLVDELWRPIGGWHG